LVPQTPIGRGVRTVQPGVVPFYFGNTGTACHRTPWTSSIPLREGSLDRFCR
jgi:hypothetical protein